MINKIYNSNNYSKQVQKTIISSQILQKINNS